MGGSDDAQQSSSSSSGGMMVVDLSLAVNYVPACLCLCKVVGLEMLFSFLLPLDDDFVECFTVAFTLLWVDRVFAKDHIFDSSCILFCVYFARIFSAVRAVEGATGVASGGVMYALLCIVWMLCCLVLSYEPPQLSRWFERRSQAHRALPTGVTVAAVNLFLFFSADQEGPVISFSRGICFAATCVAWVYIVGVQRTCQGVDRVRESSTQFTARFLPILLCPAWMAGLFALASVLILARHYPSWERGAPSARDQQPSELEAGLLGGGTPTVSVAPQGKPLSFGGHRYMPLAPFETPGAPHLQGGGGEPDAAVEDVFRLAKLRLGSIQEAGE